MKGTIVILGLLASFILIAGCSSPTSEGTTVPSAPSAQDISNFQRVFMSSYFAERGGTPHSKALTPFLPRSIESRATVPLAQLTSGITWATVISNNGQTPNSLTGYPEPGQVTVFSVTKKSSGPDIYDVTATTTFPTDDLRKTYVEEYYVEDYPSGNPDGNWTIADPIVDANFTYAPLSRVQMVLTFQDGTTRSETIVSAAGPGVSPRFNPAAFDVNGSLDLTQAFIPNLTTDTDVLYSSVVIYIVQPSVNYNFWFWQGSQAQTILGVRYYTEKQDTGAANTYTTYTASFEKTLSTLTTTGGTYASTVQGVFVGSQYDALAESVLRQKITYALKINPPPSYNTMDISQPAIKISNMQTRVVNIAGKKDFYLTQLNSDVAHLSNWATSTIYIPTGNASEIIATNNADFAFSRTGLTNPATQPLAVQTVDSSGLGPLATVYTSIITRTAIASPSGGAVLPASNIIQTANEEWVFGGANITGTRLPHTVAYDLTTKGTVEAWVYINVMTDTAGFVHKGVLADFTDECYTLQGWGNGGQIAFCIDSLGGNYDIATSDINLNTKKWYYLVGTWDTTAATPYINLYINGVLHGSARPYNTAANGAQTNNSDILIGSQLPVQYNTTWGYFGLNGKIVGANVSATPMTASDVLTKYNQYSAATVNW